ncbi:MAG: OmpA family protein [Saprospiraceae bacterium]
MEFDVKYLGLILILHFPLCIVGQRDTIYYSDFEKMLTSRDKEKGIISYQNKFGEIYNAIIGKTEDYNKTITTHNFKVGKSFLYHSPTWYRIDHQGPQIYNHFELKLVNPLLPNKYYMVSFLTGNMKSHHYKPSHYGLKFSKSRIIKNKPGELLSHPDIFYNFDLDEELTKVIAVFTSKDSIQYIYFGCFMEDSNTVKKRYIPIFDADYILRLSKEDTSVHCTRVLIDNLLIQELNPESSVFRDIYFEVDNDKITKKEDEKLIDRIAIYLLDHTDNMLMIQGYADETGTSEYNLDLSKRRSEAIKSILIAKNVPNERIITLGKGIYSDKELTDRRYARKVSFGIFSLN